MSEELTYCYKHPDRETGVSCQRCDRYICPQCSTPGAVGYLCPEDAGVPSTVVKANFQKTIWQLMPVTLVLIAANIIVFALEMLDPNVAIALEYTPTSYMDYGSLVRAFTSGFAHSTTNILHIAFNMWSLYILGRMLEPVLGKLKFIILYVLSLFAGTLGVLFLGDHAVLGASGAIFGLMASLIVVLRVLKSDARQVIILVAVNFALSFSPGIAWQAHLGGFIAGGLITLVYAKFRKPTEQATLYILIGVIAVALGGLWIYGNSILPF